MLINVVSKLGAIYFQKKASKLFHSKLSCPCAIPCSGWEDVAVLGWMPPCYKVLVLGIKDSATV